MGLKTIASASSIWKVSQLLVCLFPVVVYFYFLSHYAINIPLFDDHAFKNFILDYQKAAFFEKIQLIFSQHNEHRVAYTRIIVLLIYWFKGEIDYVWMMWIGNLSLFGIIYLFHKVLKDSKLPFVALLPLPCLLFSLALHENTFWGMASLQNFTVLFWALLLFYLLGFQKNNTFFWAMAAGFGATFTSGNGFFALAVGGLILLLQKQWKWLVVWILFTSVLAFAYFSDYQRPPGNPADANLRQIGLFIKGFLSFIGAIGEKGTQYPLESRSNWAALFGLVLLLIGALKSGQILWQCFKKQKPIINQQDWFWLGAFGFLLGSGLVVTFTRIGFGVEILLTSRYKIYSVLFLCLVYILVIQWMKPTWSKFIYPIIIGIALIFNGLQIYQSLGEVVYHRKYMICSLYNAQNFPLPSLTKNPHHPPSTWLSESVINESNQAFKIDSLYKFDHKIMMAMHGFEAGKVLDDGVYALLKSDKYRFIFPSLQNQSASKLGWLKGNYWKAGAVIVAPETDLESATYQIDMLVKTGGSVVQYTTGQRIEVTSGSKVIEKNW